MPRGKRTVFAGKCTVCNKRTRTIRLHKNRDGVSWKDYKVAKFCSTCRKRTPVKFAEERHSK
jgi:hypothetical protein